MKTLILTLFLILQGCTTYAGIAVHSGLDRPEYNGSNPLFVIRSQAENNNAFAFCEHISSVPDKEKGYGLNLCGAGLKF